jgi:hypothetical protein
MQHRTHAAELMLVSSLAALGGVAGPAHAQWTVTKDASEHDRRSVYLIAKRNLRLPFLENLDAPALQTSCARRESSTHAPQALEMLNGSLSNDLAAALARDDRQAIKTLTAASYAGARDLFEIVAPGMEMMMQAMTTAPGVIGARQAGAGFGGSMIAFVEKAHRDAFASHVSKTYFAAAGIQPEIYPVEPAPGAGVLQL